MGGELPKEAWIRNYTTPGKDADGREIRAGFYLRTDDPSKFILLQPDARGFRCSSGFAGENGGIFDQAESWKYRRATRKQIEESIEGSRIRMRWFETGLWYLEK
jgi:hypothetical protein